jgi:plastocyanin
MPSAGRIAAVLCVAAGAACGGGQGPSGPSPAPTNPFTITISPTGAVSPTELVVPPGTRVLFVNNHSRRHDMTSDPHPFHDGCTEINSVGLLQPGQSRETGNFVRAGTCGYHDHEDFENPLLLGRIVVR